MIKPIHTWDELLEEMQQLAYKRDKRGFLYLSTYGLSKDNQIKDKILEMKPTKMLIGTSAHECRADCKECRISNYLRNANIQEFKALNDFDIKITDNNHLKLMVTKDGVIIGGINLTGSNWTDSSVLITDKATIKKFKEYFEKVYKEAQEYEYTMKANKRYIFSFGKYIGLTYAEVNKIKPDYIDWCEENLDWFKTEMKLLKIKREK